MWILRLNDMRAPRIEQVEPVAKAQNPDALVALMHRERVESYTDGKWNKEFRRGGPLEWYNPPFFPDHIIDVGTVEQWEQRARDNFYALTELLVLA